MTGAAMRRAGSAVGLLASLAGLPVLLDAAAGPPTLAGLPTWGWVVAGLRDQYLPVDPLLVALGVLAWGLWAYAVLVTVLRIVAVVAARRGVAGSVSLLASTSHAVASPATLAAPQAVVRTLEAPPGWDRAHTMLSAARTDTTLAQPDAAGHPQQQPAEAPPLGAADP